MFWVRLVGLAHVRWGPFRLLRLSWNLVGGVCAAGLDSSWAGFDCMVLVQVPGSSLVGLGWFVLA